MAVERTVSAPTPFPDDVEALPGGSVVDGASVSQDLQDAADYVVIGSGAAGATAALLLASAGRSVVILEEGPWVRTRDFVADVFPAMKQMFRDLGSNMAVGRAMFPLLQGRCVGGSTTINSAIAWRVHDRILDQWSREFGLGETITSKVLQPHFEELEQALSVRTPHDKAMGNHNSLFEEAARARGIPAEAIRRYDAGCDASASCITGCRTGKKLSMNFSFVPQSLQRGGRIYTSAKVSHVESRFGRAVAVHARLSGEGAPKLRVAARRGVIVAASAIQTPNLLRSSGVRLPALGKHFQVHPATSVTGRFKRVISMELGATQGFNSTHFVDSDRFKIESLSLPPELLVVRLPGIGPQLVRKLADYQHLGNWIVVLKAEAEGTVRSVLGRDQVQYSPTPTDMARLRKGLRLLSEMMFAAGAEEVWTGVYGMPALHGPDDLRAWDDAPLDPRAYSFLASHLFGSTRMGPDPRSSVVGLDFQVHGLRGLYVLDSSIFPTNIGVNPQHTIMAIARLAAERIVERPLPARG
jgi:choline dehydrogenase-like flavoprotein